MKTKILADFQICISVPLKKTLHCLKRVRIRSYYDQYFPAFGLNTERYGVSLRIQSKCGKIRTRVSPNTDTFYTALNSKVRFAAQLKRVFFTTLNIY